jgi:thiol-disulfide isomerase/thioredoxin
MGSRTNILIVAIAVLGGMFGLYVGNYVAQPHYALTAPLLKPGERLTDLQLADASGRPRRLSEWAGKLVLVNFWATWCAPCRDEMPLLERSRRKMADKGLEIVGVAIDDPAAVGGFLRESPVSYPILVGGDSSTLYRFGDGSGVLPYSVLLSRDGRMLSQRAGSFSESGLERWLQPHLTSD